MIPLLTIGQNGILGRDYFASRLSGPASCYLIGMTVKTSARDGAGRLLVLSTKSWLAINTELREESKEQANKICIINICVFFLMKQMVLVYIQLNK